jgi:hypothetical protein
MAQAKAKEAKIQEKQDVVDEEAPTMYKNPYHKDLDKEVEDPRQTVEDTKEEATPQETGFISNNETQPNHDYKKRYDDLKSHYDRKQNENKQKLEELEAKMRLAEKNKAMADYTPPKSDDELKQFKEKYPDVYDVVETISQKQALQQTESLQEEVKTLRKREEDLVVQSAYRELVNAHTDFIELKDSPEFMEWLNTQPASISDGVTKNNKDSKWAIRVVDLYKADNGLSKSKPNSTTSAAQSVTRTKAKSVNVSGNSNKKIWKASEIQRMNPNVYEKFEKEIDTAFKEGRVDSRA